MDLGIKITFLNQIQLKKLCNVICCFELLQQWFPADVALTEYFITLDQCFSTFLWLSELAELSFFEVNKYSPTLPYSNRNWSIRT